MLTQMLEFTPLMRLQTDMNRLLEGVFEDMPALRGYGLRYPALNAWEDGECVWLEAELPGIRMEDLEVLVRGNEVTINGTRTIAAPPEATWHRRERAAGQFARTVTLPFEIEAEKVEAKLTDGVLLLKLPKCESCKPKKVKVLPA